MPLSLCLISVYALYSKQVLLRQILFTHLLFRCPGGTHVLLLVNYPNIFCPHLTKIGSTNKLF
jgi:hypothetical protein